MKKFGLTWKDSIISLVILTIENRYIINELGVGYRMQDETEN